MAGFKDRVVLVTGAGRGIGETTALLFSERRNRVIVADIAGERAEKVAAEARARGAEAIAIPLDVASGRQVKEGVGLILERYGRIDVVVNNAGVNNITPIEEITEAEWDRVFAVNAKGVFLVCQAVMATMKAHRWGRIINIGSSAGKVGGPVSPAHYSASKAAVMCFSRSLARVMAPFGVTVNAIAPGVVDTDMAQLLPAEVRQRALGAIPLGRMGSATDIAHACLYLASEEAAYITGETLNVNGGTVMD